MAIDTILLECFLATQETGSFTKAALRVHKTQSAVSQQIAKLENLIGKPLFKRNQKLELTIDGEYFLHYAKQIIALHHQVLEHFKYPQLKGEIKFGIPDDFANIFLQDILSEFIKTYPNISFHIECDLTLNLYENFKRNKLDLVLLKMPCPQDINFGVELSCEKLCWVGNEEILKNYKQLPLILSPKPCVYRKIATESLDKAKIKWQVALSSHSHLSIIAAVRAGLGIAILPQKTIPKNLPIINSRLLPKLQKSSISLLKKNNTNPVINFFENFIIKKLG